MIVFRQTDARFPFLWETSDQPAGRWHGDGEGPAHYLADTPDGAWAEFLRHEEITEPGDVLTIRRQMWAIDIGERSIAGASVPHDVATGGYESYAACQAEARRLRSAGATCLAAPSAALQPGGARGQHVQSGARPAPARDGRVIVVFGEPAALVGWVAAEAAHPSVDLLARVRHLHE